MPTKTTDYKRVEFSVRAYREATDHIAAVLADQWRREVAPTAVAPRGQTVQLPTPIVKLSDMSTERGRVKWTFDTPDELFADMQKGYRSASFYYRPSKESGLPRDMQVWVWCFAGDVSIRITMPTAAEVERISGYFDDLVETSRLPEPAPTPAPAPRVFIGHGGRSSDWLILQSELQGKHGIDCEAFESGSRAGHAIRDVLDGLLLRNSFAILIYSGEDEANGETRARQNVVHETGLFQGKLGFSKALVLREKGTELYSNLAGIQYIEYERGHVAGAVGDILAAVRREFPGRA